MPYIKIPHSLRVFLLTLICGSGDSSARADTLVWSMAEDIINAVYRGTIRTSKHVLLPWVIKTLTGNIEVIRILNQLGHGCSYTVLEEIETAIGIDKLASVEKRYSTTSVRCAPFGPDCISIRQHRQARGIAEWWRNIASRQRYHRPTKVAVVFAAPTSIGSIQSR